MSYPQPGTYASAYAPQPWPVPPGYPLAPQYFGFPQPAPYGYPAPYPPVPPAYPYPYGAPPAPYPQAYQQQPDLNQGLLGLILPLVTTLPGLKNGQAVAQNLKNQLAALQPPPLLPVPGMNVTPQQYNDLVNYCLSVKNATEQAVGNDASTFGQIKQGLLLQAFAGLGTGGGGGQNSILFLIILIAFGGLTI